MLCAAVVVAAASGCETTAPGTAIVTAGNSFQLVGSVGLGQTQYSATIPHTFTNRTGTRAYVQDESCGVGHVHLETDEGGEDGIGEWVPFWGPQYFPVIRCPLGPSFYVIEPGGAYQYTLHVRGYLTPPTASARFRIVWRAWSSLGEDRWGNRDGGDLLPLEERVSNHFTFEVEASH